MPTKILAEYQIYYRILEHRKGKIVRANYQDIQALSDQPNIPKI